MLARQEPLAFVPAPPTFGQVLRRHRLACGLSQEQLAERASLSVEAVNTLERGRRQAPRADTIARLAGALGLAGADRARLEEAALRARRAGSVNTASVARPLAVLPAPLTSFIGREQEITAIRHLLGGTRLLTLIGAPGAGKTRLALAVAATLDGDFPDGVAFVPLASVTDAGLVLLTIAHTLRLPDHAGATVRQRLQAALERRRMLLVLDNFEQVVAAVPELSELLRGCTAVTALVTSRAVLRASGEQVYVVPPLQLPPPGMLSSERIGEVEAVRLFVERARSGTPAFALADDQEGAVAAICRRLDGLPLAIELAAARIRLIPPAVLLSALERRLPLLTGGARDLPERQRTLEAAIAWSYDLLAHEIQLVFQKLSVFTGGFTLEAAEAITMLPSLTILDSLDRLLDASMLQPLASSGGIPRFGMLETLREFGLMQLDAGGESQNVRSRHAAYFLQLAEQAEPELRGHQQLACFARLEQERENLRTAFDWLAERREPAATAQCVRLVGAQWWYWYARGRWIEARRQLSQALALPGAAEPTLARAKALHGLAVLTWLQDSDANVRSLLAESLQLFEALGDQRGSALVLVHQVTCRRADDALSAEEIFAESLLRFRAANDQWGAALAVCYQARLSYWRLNDPQTAQRLCAESLALFRTVGDRWGILMALHVAGSALTGQGALDAAAPLLEESLTLAREVGDQPLVARSLELLAALAAGQGDLGRAASLCAEALDLYRELGNRSGVAGCLYQCGDLAYAGGNYARARELYQECLDTWVSMGALGYIADAQCQLAFVAIEVGDAAAATAHFAEARATLSSPLPPVYLAWLLEGLAGLAVASGQAARACRLIGAASALRRRVARARPLHEQRRIERWLGSARQTLNDDAATAAGAAGQAMTPEEAIALTVTVWAGNEPPHLAAG